MSTNTSGSTGPRINNVRGVTLMMMAFFAFSVTDMLAKLATSSLSPFEVVWFRQLGLVSGIVIALLLHGFTILKTENPFLQILRGGLAAASATFFIMAIKFMPLASAIALAFIAPFVVTTVGALVLGEKVGPRRWTAVVVGFIGTLIVLRPGLGSFHPAALLVIASATFFALRQVLSRKLAASDRTITTVAYTALASAALLTLPLPFVWQTPESGYQFALLAAMAVCAATGETLVIKALEIGEAAAVAPVQYSLIIWGTLWGWLVFSDLPDMLTIVGAAIIIATGLYVFQRERVVAARARNAQTAEPI